MTTTAEIQVEKKGTEMILTRSFSAPHALVFKAWTASRNTSRARERPGYSVPEGSAPQARLRCVIARPHSPGSADRTPCQTGKLTPAPGLR